MVPLVLTYDLLEGTRDDSAGVQVGDRFQRGVGRGVLAVRAARELVEVLLVVLTASSFEETLSPVAAVGLLFKVLF